MIENAGWLSRYSSILDERQSAAHYCQEAYKRGPDADRKDGRLLVFGTRIANAAPIYLSDDMMGVALALGQTVPDFVLRREDVYIPTAYVSLENHAFIHLDSGESFEVAALAWAPATYPRGEGVWLCLVVIDPTDDVTRFFSVGWVYGEALHEAQAQGIYSHFALSFAASLWNIMASKLSVSEKRRPIRSVRRRFKGLEELITIIRLREKAYEYAESNDHRTVNWSCRWVVREHYRINPNPSPGSPSMSIVRSHVKGPGNKPLVIKPKLMAVVR